MPGIPTAAPNVARVTYDATRNADGSYTIHDVPTVGELSAGERSNAEAIGREWMESVIAAHMAQLVGGHVAPAHAGHRTPLGEPTALGSFVPLRVRRMSVSGVMQDVLLSELTVSADTLAAIREGRYPYRSIEVDWAAGKIASLALMSGAPPHFPFPMLRDVRVLDEAIDAPPVTLAAPIVSCAPVEPGFVPVAADTRHRTLVRLAAYAVEGDEEEAPAPAEGAPADGEEKGKKPPFAKADAAAESEGDPAAEAPADATGKGLAAVMAVCARILEVLMGKKPEDRLQPARDETPEDSGDQTAPEAPAKPDDDSAKPKKETEAMATATVTLDAATTTRLAALTGQVMTLEAQVASLSAENATLKAENGKAKRAELIAAAKTRLRAKRVTIPADFDVRGDRLALLGAAALEDLVVTLETSGRKDPPETFADALDLSGVAADESEIALYADTPARLEAARREAAVYRAYKAAMPDTQLTLAKHLAIRVGAEGTPVSA